MLILVALGLLATGPLVARPRGNPYDFSRWLFSVTGFTGTLKSDLAVGYSIPHTFWHPESPHVRELLDPRDAGLKIIESYAIGQRELMVEGEPRRALGYRLNGSIEGALWYDGEGALLAASLTMPDGTVIDLRLSQVIDERSG